MRIGNFIHSMLLGSAVLLTAGSAVQAQDYPTWYGRVDATHNFVNDAKFGTGAGKGSAKFDSSWGAEGAVGYDYGNNWRTELAIGQVQADANRNDVGTALSGDATINTAMFNSYYDFDIGSPFKPYVGLGLGVATADLGSLNTGKGSILTDRNTGLAGNILAGVNVTMTQQWSMNIGYKYLQTGLYKDEGRPNGLKEDLHVHQALVGLTYRFSAPPTTTPAVKPVVAAAPVVPAPQPKVQPPVQAEPAKPVKYTVFFDFDQSNITPQARQILDQAALNAKSGKITHIDLIGHADTSGGVQYNQKLSEKRAVAVANYLAGKGVAKKEMSVSGKGKSQPLVPTADGVKEPQNRRVEIGFTSK
ncbi:MAG: OmpA family protein [Alphaproteobacteria bacterium]